jgi:hypothetical protein
LRDARRHWSRDVARMDQPETVEEDDNADRLRRLHASLADDDPSKAWLK